MKFAKEVLDEHNKYRRIHGVQPLKLDTNVNIISSAPLLIDRHVWFTTISWKALSDQY